MADVKWIKLVTNMFDNRKIKQLRKLPEGDALIVIWLQIICLAGVTNDNGFIYFSKDIPYTNEMLAVEFDRPINIIKLALATFERFGMIEIVDSILMVSNWEKYQNVDGLEKIREQTRKRVAKHRELKALDVCNVTVTDGNATELELELELDRDKDRDKDIKSNSRFTPPTLEEIKKYCLERKNKVDAERFRDFYESKGWMVGKNKMKDWKACVRTWERDDKGKEKPVSKFINYDQKEYDYDKIQRKAIEAIVKEGKSDA